MQQGEAGVKRKDEDRSQQNRTRAASCNRPRMGKLSFFKFFSGNALFWPFSGVAPCTLFRYTYQMIQRFRHKGLERLFTTGSTSGVSPSLAPKLQRILAMLNVSSKPEDMGLPGYRLHPLKGDRQGQWGVWVSGNWRVTFEFQGGHVLNVDLVDYH